MLHRCTLGLAVLFACCLPAGCHVARPASATSSARPAQTSDDDAIRLITAFVERPLGDPFLNGDIEEEDAELSPCLWSSTDHHVGSIERQILLEDNGFRVGQIIGIAPGKLLALLGSELSCANALGRTLQRGEASTVHLGPSWHGSGTFQVKLAGRSQSFTFEQPRFCLDVIARPTKDGRIELEFTPRVEHRSAAYTINVSDDLMNYVKQAAPPSRDFPMLNWKVTLKPGETLVVGANLEKPGTLGYRSFVKDDIAQPVQRVLVLRASGGTPGE